jgi:uncharacterized lipoprotein YddW (UPF0748 family)
VKICLYLFLAFFFVPLTILSQEVSPKYEFRGVWVATVNNIDWPSKPGLSVKELKEETIRLLNLQQKLGMNAIIFQVRPAADAFYPSSYEPWSRYLSGTPGKAPEHGFDPLAFWIEECHFRGMEFHAWFNPFRVAQNFKGPLAANHVAFSHPEWILKYGNQLLFDPGIPEVRDFTMSVVMDVVKRYDVDAIHFDDYFYPYPLPEAFPDTASFRKFSRAFRPEDKDDWRRENIDLLIHDLSREIKKAKPWVKFGISSFGVWQNKSDDPEGSDTRAGVSSFRDLHANVIKWQAAGWIDYLVPQIYWQIGHPSVDFLTLSNWWSRHRYERSLYIGQAVYKIGVETETSGWSQPSEMPQHIRLNRKDKGIGGSAFFSSNHFGRNLFGLQDSLANNLYAAPALVPPMPWIDSVAPEAPIRLHSSGKKIRWKVQKKAEVPIKFGIYISEKGAKPNLERIYELTTADNYRFEPVNRKRKKYQVWVTAVDRLSNESQLAGPVQIKL